MQGSPVTMQENPSYKNVVQEVKEFLEESIKISKAAGILSDQIAIDPGIGFGKNLKHNLEILNKLEMFIELGKPNSYRGFKKIFHWKYIKVTTRSKTRRFFSSFSV